MSITVELSWREVAAAARAGADRQVVNLAQGNKDAHRFDREPWSTHIAGALAECAFAKALDRYWLPIASDFKALAGDVGAHQIRSTDRRSGCLILHRSDPDASKFWLVLDDCPRYTVVGWAYGVEGKREKFWRTDTGRPAFFVPQQHLRPAEQVEAVAA